MQQIQKYILNPYATHLCAFIFGCLLLKVITASSVKTQMSLKQNVLFQIDGIVSQGDGQSFLLGTNQNCILSDAPVRLIQGSEHPIYMVSLPRAQEILKLLKDRSIATLRWISRKDAPHTLCYESPKVIYGSF